jgi:hypothetical protein
MSRSRNKNRILMLGRLCSIKSEIGIRKQRCAQAWNLERNGWASNRYPKERKWMLTRHKKKSHSKST